MAGGRKVPLWRGRFLRALRRTGNVTQAALAAGVDRSSAYPRRKSEPDFAAKWAAAEAAGKQRSALCPRPGQTTAKGHAAQEDLIVRNSKNGAQLVRPGPGRWSRKVEQAFLDHYAQSGCIKWAARAAGVSANIIHYRKQRYPGFAADCAAAEARAKERLQGLVTAAGIASFDPDYAEEEVPRVSVAEAIAILRLKGPGSAAGAGAKARPLPSIEQVRDEVLRRIAAIRRHQEEAQSRSGEGFPAPIPSGDAAPSPIASGDGPPPRSGEDL
jgi:hypothetical protein